jgi:16S rRNA U516 pseudouridylate synthase RsuA-like enzyme
VSISPLVRRTSKQLQEEQTQHDWPSTQFDNMPAGDNVARAAELKAEGNALVAQDRWSEAAALFAQCATLDGGNHIHFSNLSACHAQLRDYDAALRDASRCVALCPGWAKGYARKATALFALGRLTAAEAVCRAGLEVDAGQPGILMNLEIIEQARQMGVAETPEPDEADEQAAVEMVAGARAEPGGAQEPPPAPAPTPAPTPEEPRSYYYFVLHKPRDTLTSTVDSDASLSRRTVYDCARESGFAAAGGVGQGGAHAVGRLDYATSGLLLFTDDPAVNLAFRSGGVVKNYVLTVGERLTAEDARVQLLSAPLCLPLRGVAGNDAGAAGAAAQRRTRRLQQDRLRPAAAAAGSGSGRADSDAGGAEDGAQTAEEEAEEAEEEEEEEEEGAVDEEEEQEDEEEPPATVEETRPAAVTVRRSWRYQDQESEPEWQTAMLADMRRCGKATESVTRAYDGWLTELEVRIDQGRYHQVRKLCERSRLKLRHLHRESVGGVAVGELPVGACRDLSARELDEVFRRWLPAQAQDGAHAARGWRQLPGKAKEGREGEGPAGENSGA